MQIESTLNGSINSETCDVTWDMWEHQNEALHDGPQAKQQILHSVVDAQVCKLYNGGMIQLPHDTLHFLNSMIETILAYPLQLKQQWVEMVQAAQERQKQHEYGAYLLEPKTEIEGKLALGIVYRVYNKSNLSSKTYSQNLSPKLWCLSKF